MTLPRGLQLLALGSKFDQSLENFRARPIFDARPSASQDLLSLSNRRYVDLHCEENLLKFGKGEIDVLVATDVAI